MVGKVFRRYPHLTGLAEGSWQRVISRLLPTYTYGRRDGMNRRWLSMLVAAIKDLRLFPQGPEGSGEAEGIAVEPISSSRWSTILIRYGYRYRMGLAMPGCRPDAPVGTDPGPGRTGTSYSGP